jgi:uncharacterized protein (UPF0276 family)
MKSAIGIGFRRDFAQEFLETDILKPAFIEIAPENWIKLGGQWRGILDEVAGKHPIFCHGLSLSIGSPDPLDKNFLKDLKGFLEHYQVALYSEHLSYSKCDNAHLYDLLPIPFREDAVNHISDRIKEVQDYLGRELVLENVSYYTPVGAQMPEHEFLSKIIERSGCGLLLDINNVYVNAFNHGYDAKTFIRSMPHKAVRYMHMAGHLQVSKDCIIDTHGEAIIDPVYDLFEYSLDYVNKVPVLLERDFNIPELSELQKELNHLQQIADKKWNPSYVKAE